MNSLLFVSLVIRGAATVQQLVAEGVCALAGGFCINWVDTIPSGADVKMRIGVMRSARNMNTAEVEAELGLMGARLASVPQILQALSHALLMEGIIGGIAVPGSTVTVPGLDLDDSDYKAIATLTRGRGIPWTLGKRLHSDRSIWVPGWNFAAVMDGWDEA